MDERKMPSPMIKSSRKQLQTARRAWPLVKNYYIKARQEKRKNVPIGWTFGMPPVEIFHALGVIPIMTDLFSGILASKQQIPKYLEIAEDMGFPSFACSLHKAAIGYSLAEEDLMIPPPDFIFAISNICDGFIKASYPALEHFDIPYYFLDSPYCTAELKDANLMKEAVRYFAEQLEGFISFIEGLTHIPFDKDRLKNTLQLATRTCSLWEEINELRKVIPCPMGAADEIVTQVPLMQLMGTKELVGFYEMLLTEIKERVRNRQGVIEEEKIRLLWVGNSPCYDTAIFNYFDEFGALLVRTDAEYTFMGELDETNCLESLARKMILNPLNGSVEKRIEIAKRLVRDYKIDGMVLYCHFGCRVFTGGHRAVIDAIYNEFGIPSLLLYGDMADARNYSGDKIREEIEDFIQILER